MSAEHDGRDIAQFIQDQHEEIRHLLDDVASHQGIARREAFEELVRLLAVHETAEEEVMYPVVREARGGDAVAEARISEESDAKQMLAGVEHAGVESDEFAPRFAVMRQTVLKHAELEEATVLPLLEQVADADRLIRLGQMTEVAESRSLRSGGAHGHMGR